MTNLFLLGAKYVQEGVAIKAETLKKIWQIRSQDFAECGVSENNFVYKICEESYQAFQQGRVLVNDEASHTALTEMADIGLFLNKQKAHGEKVEFNNASQLITLLGASRTLKGVHSELFERYGFQENLPIIAKLQCEKENSLQDKIQKAMDAIFDEKVAETKRETQEKMQEGK